MEDQQPIGDDPFAVLGLQRRYDVDAAELERRYRDLQKALHPDRHAGTTASQRRMSLSHAMQVNEAYRTLRDDLSRASALLRLHGGDVTSGDGASDPEFLMQMMELREALSDAKAGGDLERVRALSSEVEAMRANAAATMADAFGGLGELGEADAEALMPIAAALSRLRFFARFLDEVSLIEEEALG